VTTQTPTEHRARIGPRLLGIAIDWTLSLLISSAFFASASYAGATGVERALFAGAPLATLAIWALQHLILVATIGTTIGHRLVGIRVVRDDRDGPVGLVKAGIRTALLALVLPAVVWDSEGRGLHDRAAGTRLISVRSRP
jgi:uncharacterized RDD family membrane protein YckC